MSQALFSIHVDALMFQGDVVGRGASHNIVKLTHKPVDALCLANIQTVVGTMVNYLRVPHTYNLYSEQDASSSPPPNLRSFSKAIKPTIRPNLRWLKRLAIALSVTLWSSPAFALPLHSNFTQNLHNKSAPYTPPPDAGTPMPTGGTGSRGGCVDIHDRPPLAALVGQHHLMLTTSDRPVFWIYVPYTPEEASSGFISLQQGDNAIYEGTFSLASASESVTPGVVGIQLPTSAPSLVAGQEYDWFIDINCVMAIDNSKVSDDTPESLDGLVQRVEVSDDLANDLSQAQTGLEVVAAYGRHHIWYDWLTELARLRLATEADNKLDNTGLNNTELDTTWTTVLSDKQTVLLDTWATEPLVGEIAPIHEHSPHTPALL